MRTRENAKDAIRCAAEQIFQPTMAEWQSVALAGSSLSRLLSAAPRQAVGKHVFRSHADPLKALIFSEPV